MKNKTKNQGLNTIDSDGCKKFNMPDYPDYPDCDDIYNIYLNRNEFDPEYILKAMHPHIYQKNMKAFSDLTEKQKQALLKFPIYISLLAATDDKMDEEERMVAIKFAHTKAFSCQPLLTEFCQESEKVFEKNLVEIVARSTKRQSEQGCSN